MLKWHLFVLMGLTLQPVPVSAQREYPAPISSTRQLRGLSSDEATALIAKLEEAQGKLRAAEFQSFELLSGSIAAYEMTKVSPREAFLQMPFEKAWEIRKIATDNRLWQPFKLAYAPDGLGSSIGILRWF